MKLVSREGKARKPRTRPSYGASAGRSPTKRALKLGPVRWSRASGRAWSLAALLLLIWLSVVLFSSDAFFVFEVEVEGNTRITAQEVFWGSGLAEKAWSIFFLDPREAEARILRDVRGVKSAEVRCYLPSRVIVRIEERRPDVIWKTGEALFWVDEEGVILEPVQGQPEGSIVVLDLDQQPLIPEDRVSPDVIGQVQRLQYLLPEANDFRYSQATGISLLSAGGWPVYFGGPDDLEEKVAIMRALDREIALGGIQVEYVDLRFSRGPCIKERAAQS